jgi:hypothetical protein
VRSRDRSTALRFLAAAMRKFRVRLQGRNFLIPVEGKGESKHGFYTNRFVEAVDEMAAELAAVDQLRRKQSLRDVVRNTANDPPGIFLDELQELSSFDGLPSLDQGLVWYPEDAPKSAAK